MVTSGLLRAFLSQPPDVVRSQLPGLLEGYIHPSSAAGERVRRNVSEALATVEAPDWLDLLDFLGRLGAEFRDYRAHPLARRLADGFLQPLLQEGWTVEGHEHIDRAMKWVDSGRRVMAVCNHLSYADTFSTISLLAMAGRERFAGLLTPLAGPKVYMDPMRLFAVAGMNSIKVAQSTSVATGQRAVSPRELVRISRRCMDIATRLMDEGQVVLIYPEGTRSRTGRLRPFLAATGRWLSLPGVVLLPMAQIGTEKLYELDDDRLRPAVIHVRAGAPIDTAAFPAGGAGRSRREQILAAAHEGLAELLPEGYQPEAGAARVG